MRVMKAVEITFGIEFDEVQQEGHRSPKLCQFVERRSLHDISVPLYLFYPDLGDTGNSAYRANFGPSDYGMSAVYSKQIAA